MSTEDGFNKEKNKAEIAKGHLTEKIGKFLEAFSGLEFLISKIEAELTQSASSENLTEIIQELKIKQAYWLAEFEHISSYSLPYEVADLKTKTGNYYKYLQQISDIDQIRISEALVKLKKFKSEISNISI